MTRATLRDVAARAGVSHQTVSNVLNDHPSIRPTTRARVLTAIKALDYHPNLAAKALRESRVTTLCCAFYGHSADNINDPYRNLIQSAFIAEATAGGYSVITAFLDEAHPESFQTLRRAFMGQRFAGMVLVSTRIPQHRLNDFVQWGMPTVLFDHADQEGVLPSVTGQFADGMAQLVAHHVSRGRRRLALVLPSGDLGGTSLQRLEGFRRAVVAHGVVGEVTEGDWSSESGERAFERLWVADRRPEDQRPDAVLCGNDRMAVGAMLAARTLGVNVPHDVAISGFDDFEFARYVSPGLTTVHVPHGDMGRHAVRLLLDRLEAPADDRPKLESVQTPLSLVVRESA